MSLDQVTPGKHVPDAFNVIIEIPMNADPVKYEVDKETGAIFVDRFMSTSMHYPTNYGYVPKTIAGDGLSRADVQRFVFEHARLPLGTLKLGGMWGIHDWPRWMHAITDDDALVPQVPSPEDVMVIVAGGPGKHSSVVPNCTFSRAVSRPVRPIHP